MKCSSIVEKRCTLCKETKPASAFYPRRGGKYISSRCAECIKTTHKKQYKNDTKHREYILARQKRWNRENLEHTRKKTKEWNRDNPEKAVAMRKRAYAKRISSIHGRLQNKVLSLIHRSVRTLRRGIPTPWAHVLGYDFERLKQHLESLFTEGMTWDAVLASEIEIDHILPRSSFYYETVDDPDFKACWELTNLQPLWKADNRSKGDKMPDGQDGRTIGRFKKDMYEARLAEMTAGG